MALVDVFSGPQSTTGRVARNGLQVAVDSVNASGGVLGNRLEVDAADGEGNPDKARELVREELTDGQVKLLVGPDSTATFTGARSLIGQAGLPNCVTAVSADALNNASTSFLSGPDDQARVQALLGAVSRLHPDIKKIALLDEGEDSGAVLNQLLSTQAATRGLQYAGRTVVGAGDHATAVQALVAQGVQAIVLSQQATVAARTAQAATQLGVRNRVLLLGLGAAATYDFADQAGDASVTTLVVTPNASYLTATAETGWPAGYRSFVDAATRQYGLAADGVQVQGDPAPADCVLLWARAVQQAGTFRGADVFSALRKLNVGADVTAMGVQEQLGADRSTVANVAVYAWAKAANRYRLTSV